MIGLGCDKNEKRYRKNRNSISCRNCSELKWVALVCETFWKVDNCNWPIPTTTVSLLPRAKTWQVNFNCTKRTLWFWILDFIFAFEWAEKMFVVNQHGKDSYLGNTQAFCRETNHKKRKQVYFNLNFLLKGFILYLSWIPGQKKSQKNFNLNLELIFLLILTSHARCLFPHRVGAEPHLKWRMVNINIYSKDECVGRGKEELVYTCLVLNLSGPIDLLEEN